jgi:type IV pilus assembly protein PilO
MAEGKNLLERTHWSLLLAALIVAALLVGYLLDGFLFNATREETNKKQTELTKLREENRKGAIVRDNLKTFQNRFDQAQSQLRDLRELLPEDVEISNILKGIQDQAVEQKLNLKGFKPADLVSKEFYKEKPISIQVSGLYDNLGFFFQQLATYRRIVNISEVEIKKAPQQNSNYDIDASFRVTAFLASEQDINNVPGEKGAAKAGGK